MTVKLFRNMNLFTPVDTGAPLKGTAQGVISEIRGAAMLCCNGIIEQIGAEADVLKKCSGIEVHEELNLHGSCVIPGFVDPHTHMCFAAKREAEFKLRLSGTPYLEILKQGGGILSSVRAVRAATEETLYEQTRKLALSALRLGTTTVEIKSGYGLDLDSELKMLRCIRRVQKETPLDVAITFMGAHAIPEEYKGKSDDFVEILIRDMLPMVRSQGIAEFCDIFCEEGVFSVEQSRKILLAAKKMGFGIKIHADEVHDLGGASLAGELGVDSAEHLLAAGDFGLTEMGKKGIVAVLLPGTAYSLRKPYAQARRMIDLSVPVALATDCNPGSCFCESMPFIFGLSVLNMGMTPEEALTGATLNAAYAIKRSATAGSLQAGKNADFLILDGETPAALAYHAGGNSIGSVYKRAELVHKN